MTNQAFDVQSEHDRLYEQFFVQKQVDGWIVGVLTTGIYCAAGCPARRPRPENVRFFRSPEEARAAGLRACLRCRPDAPGGLTADEAALVTRAVQLMEQEGGRTTAQLARALGCSPQLLDRLVRRATGVSLATLDESRRFARLRRALPEAPSVTEAIYAAGFSGPRRVYERGNDMLGMTPGRFRNGGAGETIGYATATVSLGTLGLAKTGKGICFVCVRQTPEAATAEIRRVFHKAVLLRDDDTQRITAVLADAVNSRAPLPDLPLDIQATAFEAQVWQALRAIPRGTTLSYGEIAARIGNPRASRAVGRACGANPVALLVPCHRAVGSNGQLTGFAWGLPAKARLLQDEGALLETGHGTLL